MTEWWHVPTWRGRQLKPERWSALYAPMRWTRKPRVVLADDIFAGKWTNEERDRAFAVMALCPQHLFVLPTFFAENAKKYIDDDPQDAINSEAGTLMHWDEMPDDQGWPLPNLWLGTHVETQDEADRLVPPLLATPAALRFVHVTPRGAIDMMHLRQYSGKPIIDGLRGLVTRGQLARSPSECSFYTHTIIPGELPWLDWLIVEGGTDPMRPDWVRSLRDQCAAARVPFNFAGWGRMLPWEDWVTDEDEQAAKRIITVQHSNSPAVTRYLFMSDPRRSGRSLDGIEHSAFPEMLDAPSGI